MPKAERKLPYLPEQGAPDFEFRDWLTPAVGCPADVQFGDVTRHGPELSDPCTFTLHAPGGDVLEFTTSQRLLANTAQLRSTLVYATNGLLRPDHHSRPELEDIWIAMIVLSNVLDTQAQSDETWSWLVQYERACDTIEGLSLAGERRLDALLALKRRPSWGRIEAQAAKPVDVGARPVWVIDEQTREQYVRASEFLTFLRHGLVVGPVGGSDVTSRLHVIGGQRVLYAVRSRVDRGLYPRIVFYLLPASDAYIDGR